MVTNVGVTGPLFAPPRIVAGPGGPRDIDGTVVLRSAEPLGDYPVSVVHSLREWARIAPGHPAAAAASP